MSEHSQERLRQNVASVQHRAADAARRAGRDPDDVTLVAVTKTVSHDVAAGLIEAGVRHLGENRIQEGERKHRILTDPESGLDAAACTWHMIGHLQRNKVAKAVDIFQVIHSVDSERLLSEISRRAVARSRCPDILLEINVSGEESKYGAAPDQAADLAAVAAGLPGLRLRGLMTMAPFSTDPGEARPFFKSLAGLLRRLNESGVTDRKLDMLSMGMTGDFEVAVEEGATHIRVGTALFRGL